MKLFTVICIESSIFPFKFSMEYHKYCSAVLATIYELKWEFKKTRQGKQT